MARRLTDDELEARERRARMRAAGALDRAPRGPSVVTPDEERRLYELNRAGVDAPIRLAAQHAVRYPGPLG